MMQDCLYLVRATHVHGVDCIRKLYHTGDAST